MILINTNMRKKIIHTNNKHTNKSTLHRKTCETVIINEKNFMPKVSENINDFDLYLLELAEYIKNAKKISFKLFAPYHKSFNKNFNVLNGIESIYDFKTGGVYFDDDEWIASNSSKLQKLFNQRDKNDNFIYSLPVNNGIILRGSSIYYYFSSYTNRFTGATTEEAFKWLDNCICFCELTFSLIEYCNLKDTYDLRYLLAILDNLRNIILLLENSFIVSIYKNSTAIFNNNQTTRCEILLSIHDCILKICTKKLTKNFLFNVKEIIMSIIKEINKLKTFSPFRDKKNDLIKCFNPLREADNFFENYITLKYVAKKIRKLYKPKSKINLIGIMYGGLELPYILKSILKTHYEITIYLIHLYSKPYLERQNEKNFKNNRIRLFPETYNELQNSNNILIDENIMSGKTLQDILFVLTENKIIVNRIVVLRHPDINRVFQMKYFNNACVLNNLKNEFIIGAINSSALTKINENCNENFKNNMGIVSQSAQIFLEAIYNNNTYIKNSETDIINNSKEQE